MTPLDRDELRQATLTDLRMSFEDPQVVDGFDRLCQASQGLERGQAVVAGVMHLLAAMNGAPEVLRILVGQVLAEGAQTDGTAFRQVLRACDVRTRPEARVVG